MALADRDFQQMLIEGGLEPDLDSTPEKFRRALEGDCRATIKVRTERQSG